MSTGAAQNDQQVRIPRETSLEKEPGRNPLARCNVSLISAHRRPEMPLLHAVPWYEQGSSGCLTPRSDPLKELLPS